MVSLVVILGGIIFGEAVALLVGASIIRNKTSQWLDKKNGFFLVLDMVSSVLLIIALPPLHYLPEELFFSALLIAIISHIYRTNQYYSNDNNKFCDNKALFIVNNIKLLGLLAVIVLLLV